MSKRAANGRSSIYPGADGRWHGYVTMGVRNDGRPDRRHVTGRTEKIVAGKVQELERQRSAGHVANSGRAPTVEEWLTHWLETIAAAKVRASTLSGYRTYVEGRLVPGLGAHRLDRLQPEHVERLYRDLREDGMAPASVLQCHRILSRALKVAVQRGRVARTVCTLVDAPSVQHHEVEPLTADEARRILAAAEGGRNAARWSVALAIGLRQGEALGLRWVDVDLEAGTLAVRQALQRLRGQKIDFVPPKSRAGRRTVLLPVELVEALRAHRAAQEAERVTADDRWEESGLVFAQANGKPLDPSADRRAWKALLVRAGVRPARLHDARHTAATLLLQQGVPARVAMQVLGHSQVSLTLNTYSHVTRELDAAAAVAAGAVLRSATATRTATIAESGGAA